MRRPGLPVSSAGHQDFFLPARTTLFPGCLPTRLTAALPCPPVPSPGGRRLDGLIHHQVLVAVMSNFTHGHLLFVLWSVWACRHRGAPHDKRL